MLQKLSTLIMLMFVSSTLWAQTAVDGTWDFAMNSEMGAVNAKVMMKAEGAVLTGEFDMGNGRKWVIEDGTITGNAITFNINRDGASMTYVMSGSVDGNSITGNAAAMGTTVDWSMTRAQ